MPLKISAKFSKAKYQYVRNAIEKYDLKTL